MASSSDRDWLLVRYSTAMDLACGQGFLGHPAQRRDSRPSSSSFQTLTGSPAGSAVQISLALRPLLRRMTDPATFRMFAVER
jgi:hypothetical protein